MPSALIFRYSVLTLMPRSPAASLRLPRRRWSVSVINTLSMDSRLIARPSALGGDEGGQDRLGHVVIGTIEGDIHDIGKTLVATMLAANGFEVTDLGADVPVAKFVETAEEKGADWIAISALLTTTMPGQKKVIEQLEAKSLRRGVKVMVGGAPCSEEWASEIGADGYAGDAVAAVALAKGQTD